MARKYSINGLNLSLDHSIVLYNAVATFSALLPMFIMCYVYKYINKAVRWTGHMIKYDATIFYTKHSISKCSKTTQSKWEFYQFTIVSFDVMTECVQAEQGPIMIFTILELHLSLKRSRWLVIGQIPLWPFLWHGLFCSDWLR